MPAETVGWQAKGIVEVLPDTAEQEQADSLVYLIRQLLSLDLATLLELSEQAATQALAVNPATITASPIIITNSCTTTPRCRHCKWEHFKATREASYQGDRPLSSLIQLAHSLADIGTLRAYLATGWLGYRLPKEILETVETICTAEPRLEYYGLFGALDKQSHHDLASAGLSGMLTSLESPNEQVYRSFRPGGDSLQDRLRALEYAREAGLKIWTGFLVGFGENAADVASGIDTLLQIEPESVSILPFVPFKETEMGHYPPTDKTWLAQVNAAARITLPPSTVLFSDHYEDVDERYGASLGFNGSYEIRQAFMDLITSCD